MTASLCKLLRDSKYFFQYEYPLKESLFKEGRKFNGRVTLELIANEINVYDLELPLLKTRNQRMLDKEVLCDFSLIAENNAKRICHKGFLAGKTNLYSNTGST